jgi:hypothetical protein
MESTYGTIFKTNTLADSESRGIFDNHFGNQTGTRSEVILTIPILAALEHAREPGVDPYLVVLAHALEAELARRAEGI